MYLTPELSYTGLVHRALAFLCRHAPLGKHGVGIGEGSASLLGRQQLLNVVQQMGQGVSGACFIDHHSAAMHQMVPTCKMSACRTVDSH